MAGQRVRYGIRLWYTVSGFPLLTSFSNSRVFPLVAALLALSYHALAAVLCTYLPRDSMVIGYGAAGYATVGCAISLLGMYGILTVCLARTLSNIENHTDPSL